MGVYISNMSKPKSCYLCTFRIIDPTDGSVCGCVVGHIQGIPLDQDRADDCPLIEIDDTVWENEKYKLIRMTQAVRINKEMAERRVDEDGDRVVETAPVRP